MIVLGLLVFFAASSEGLTNVPDECFCAPIDPPPPGVEVECDPSLDNGLWTVGAQCRYTCLNERQVIRAGDSDTRECRPAFEFPEDTSGDYFIWVPEEPECVDDPNICQASPFWNEVPPGDVAGTIDCGALTTEEEEYPIGHVCTYACPDGFHLVGNDTTVCTTDPEGGFFTPQSPCCEQDCQPTDVLYVVDWSSSIRRNEWDDMRGFLSQLTTELRRNTELRFGVEVFGAGVRQELNIPFEPYSQDLVDRIASIPFNEVGFEGTQVNAALQFATNTVFGSSSFNDRPDAPNVVIFITDGVSTDGRVAASAQALHELTESVFAVGIGLNDPNRIKFAANRAFAQQDLASIAQTSGNVAQIENFSGLFESVSDVIDSFCSAACVGFGQLD